MSILPFADLVTDNLDGIPFLSGNLLFHVFLPCQDHLFLVFPGETLVSVLKMLIKLTVIDNKKMVNSNLFMSSNLGRSTSFCPVSHPALPTNTSKLQAKQKNFLSTFEKPLESCNIPGRPKVANVKACDQSGRPEHELCFNLLRLGLSSCKRYCGVDL